MRDLAIDVAELVPLVVGTVEPDGQRSAGFQILRKRLHRLLTVWRMVQNPYAVDEIKTLRRKRKSKHVSLKCNELAVGQVSRRHFCGSAQIDAHHLRSPASCHVGKPSHTATHIEHEFSLEVFGSQTSLSAEIFLGLVAGCIIQLSAGIALPLKAKAVGIVFRRNEARDATLVRERALAAGTHVAVALRFER